MARALPESPLGKLIRSAIERVRKEAADPTTGVVVVTPSVGSAELARRALALTGPYIRVAFQPPERIATALGEVALAASGRRLEPAGWLASTLREAIHQVAEDPESVIRLGAGDPRARLLRLASPGWLPSLESAVREVELAGLSSAKLHDVACSEALRLRLTLLAKLLHHVEERRTKDRVANVRALHEAALASVDDPSVPFNRYGGAVVLGDGTSSPGQFDVLKAWLAARPGVRIAISPLENLDPAPSGLREAAAHLPVLAEGRDAVVLDRGRAVDRLRRDLFSTSSGGDLDDSVSIVWSPDEMREMREVVREVQRAIRAGTPLDRIAVGLPDATAAEVLEDALETAGIPAVWLIGPSLARDPAARLLRQALKLQLGEDSVADWYSLLRHPLLVWPKTADARRGSTRWRKILSRCGAVRGSSTILAAIDAQAAKLDPTDDTQTTNRAAHQTLLRAMRAIHQDVEALPSRASLGGHARTWLSFAKKWIGRDFERIELDELLRSFGDGVGPELQMEEALAELERALEAKPHLEGRMTEPKIRVVPPMEMLAGEMDLVCLVGMAEGRFPKRREEDVFLTDELVQALRAATGARLLTSIDRTDHERRRLAAAVSACTGRLWLSTPGTELMSARPQRPSRLLLDVMSALTGRRASFSQLAAITKKAGSRARFGPEDPADAIDATERWVSQLARAGAVESLAQHPTTRRLLQLHRSIDRYRIGLRDGGAFVDAWTGLISPGLAGGPVSGEGAAPAQVFAEAALRPASYFFRRLLNAWPAESLYGTYDATADWIIRQRVQDALRRAFETHGPDLLARFTEAWREADTTLFDHKPEVNPTTIALAGELGHHVAQAILQDVEELATTHAAPYPEATWEGWTISAGTTLGSGDTLVSLVRKNERKRLTLPDAFGLVVEAQASGADWRNLLVVSAKADVGRAVIQDLSTSAAELAVHTRSRAACGMWPTVVGDTDRFALGAERDLPADALDPAFERLLEAIRTQRAGSGVEVAR